MNLRKAVIFGTAVVVMLAAVVLLRGNSRIQAADGDYRTARVEKREFRKTVRRIGVLQPVSEEAIYSKVRGNIIEIVPQGSIVAKGDVVLKVDTFELEDERASREASIRKHQADRQKQKAESSKSLNQAREDLKAFDLRIQLEQMRLEELRKGPTPADEANAQSNLTNSRNLRAALEEELTLLKPLMEAGFLSEDEFREKELAVSEQRLKVESAEIELKKLHTPDPIALKDQELKLREVQQQRESAVERVALLEDNAKRDEERWETNSANERTQLKQTEDQIANSTYTAPGPGVVVYTKQRWYNLGPGRGVWEGMKLMSIPDFSKMKVALTVDEARIPYVAVGQVAEIRPAGWTGAPFSGTVKKVAEKGRDEFENYQWETLQISGTANRQVFDVEVEIAENSPIFRLGLRTTVDIVLSKIDDAKVLPRTAVFREKDGSVYARVVSNTGVERRKIKVLAENDVDAVIEGVEENERVWISE